MQIIDCDSDNDRVGRYFNEHIRKNINNNFNFNHRTKNLEYYFSVGKYLLHNAFATSLSADNENNDK
jgi:hypothetical protein